MKIIFTLLVVIFSAFSPQAKNPLVIKEIVFNSKIETKSFHESIEISRKKLLFCQIPITKFDLIHKTEFVSRKNSKLGLATAIVGAVFMTVGLGLAASTETVSHNGVVVHQEYPYIVPGIAFITVGSGLTFFGLKSYIKSKR